MNDKVRTFTKPKVGDLYRWAGNSGGIFLRLLIGLTNNRTIFKIIILSNDFKQTSIGADELWENILTGQIIHYEI